MRGATSPAAVITTWPGLFQSTRPCRARHARHERALGAMVSIHAPVRGETFGIFRIVGDFQFQSTRPCGARPIGPFLLPGESHVSIHAPVRGATLGFDWYMDQTVLFQSTRPCGARRRRWASSVVPGSVSIHAPVRGATVGTAFPRRTYERFNPRARAGRDVLTVLKRGAIPVFQSTRPCGARPPTYNLLISMKKTFYFSETCLI